MEDREDNPSLKDPVYTDQYIEHWGGIYTKMDLAEVIGFQDFLRAPEHYLRSTWPWMRRDGNGQVPIPTSEEVDQALQESAVSPSSVSASASAPAARGELILEGITPEFREAVAPANPKFSRKKQVTKKVTVKKRKTSIKKRDQIDSDRRQLTLFDFLDAEGETAS